MRLIHIRAGTDEYVECLLRELAVYRPTRVRRRAILIQLQHDSNSDISTLLSAIEACIRHNDIRSVRLELDGESYTLAAP